MSENPEGVARARNGDSLPETESFEPLIDQTVERIQAICEFFEQRLLTQQPVRIEDFLGGFAPNSRAVLLSRLLSLEIGFRKRSGPVPTRSEYYARFPADVDVVQEFFGPDRAEGDAGPCDWPAIPNYVIYGELGAGGMGIVYRAIQVYLRNEAAIKVVKQERMQVDALQGFFQQEMRNVGQLQHPNVVRALNAGVTDGLAYLVMEMVHGLDTADVLRRCGPLAVADACEIARQSALGLQHAHEHGIVHRDVKPSNLLLGWRSQQRDEAEVKVADFGLAILRPEAEGCAKDGGQRLIQGTFDYMAPEQYFTPQDVDIRADIFALGCTLYSLLIGRPPFAGSYRNIHEKMLAHRDQPVEFRRDLRPDVPLALEEVIQWTMAKDREHRFESPAELAASLLLFNGGHDLVQLLDTAEGRADPRKGA